METCPSPPTLLPLHLLSPLSLCLIHQLLLQKVSQILHPLLSPSLATTQAFLVASLPPHRSLPGFLQSGPHTGGGKASLLKCKSGDLSSLLEASHCKWNYSHLSSTPPPPTQGLCYQILTTFIFSCSQSPNLTGFFKFLRHAKLGPTPGPLHMLPVVGAAFL